MSGHPILSVAGFGPLLLALAACCAPRADEPSPVELPGTPVSELDPSIWVMLQASNGDLWFGSNGRGVFRFDGKVWTRLDEDDGLVGGQVRDLVEHSSGDVLISTRTGVTRFDGHALTPLAIERPSDGDGWVLDPDDAWLVSDWGMRGPLRYDGERLLELELTGSREAEALARAFPDPVVPPTGIYDIHRDRRGHLWFGTGAVGVCRFDGTSLDWLHEEPLTTTPEGGSFGIRSILEDASGRFWIGNTRQTFRMAREASVAEGYRRLRYEREPGLTSTTADDDPGLTYVASMAEDSGGVLWMAAGFHGVWRYDGEELTRFDLPDGSFAIRILLDDAGQVWAGTVDHGVHVFDGEAFVAYAVP